jgi:polyisoprenoid-binding protein YceI
MKINFSTIMKKLIGTCIVVAALYACGSNTESSKNIDACACAAESLKEQKDSVMMRDCDAKRTQDASFEKSFQKCYLSIETGIDTAKVSVSKIDTTKGLDLPPAGSGLYTIENDKSKMRWTGRKITGQHNGTVPVSSGELTVENGILKGGSIIIDLSGLICEDLSGESKNELESILKGPDFFDVTKSPTAKFLITSVRQINPHQFEITGDLTIRNQTVSQSTKILVLPNGSSAVNVSGGIAIDRTKFGIKYGSGKFFKDLGDNLIDDTFALSFDLKAKK